jgi:ubiquinone/menaquinone biosynthesis C-methylase UbiE
VLEHVAEPEQLWDEMYRILKKGGRILMNVPFYYWLHEPPYDYYRYTEYCLRRMAEKRGFHLLLLRSIGGTPEILADIFSKHILHIPIFGKFLSIGIQYVIYVFIKTNLGAKLSNKTSKVFPFGYFLIAEKAA